MKEITKFRREYLKKAQEEFEEDICAEDLEFWIECQISSAINLAYKIGVKEGTEKVLNSL